MCVSMMTLSVSSDIDFLIENCGYSTMHEEYEKVVEDFLVKYGF